MKLENQVCSLELAKKLKELGVPQESLFYWFVDNEQNLLAYKTPIGGTMPNGGGVANKYFEQAECYSAFTVAELGEMLKTKYSLPAYSGGLWRNVVNWGDGFTFAENTEADARVKMLIYLLENKLLTIN